MAKTTPEISEDISGALKRLIGGGRGGMGSMFKVLAVSDATNSPALAGFGDEPIKTPGRAHHEIAIIAAYSAIPASVSRVLYAAREAVVEVPLYRSLNGGLGSNDDPAQ
jgi:hypothetical protein